MKNEYEFEPYKKIGRFAFGTPRSKIINTLGEPLSTQMDGYPIADSYLDDYNFFYILCSNKETLEAVQFFPEYTDDEIALIYKGKSIRLSADIDKTTADLRAATDDLTEETDGYSSERLGLEVFCPDDCVENVIVFDRHYFD